MIKMVNGVAKEVIVRGGCVERLRDYMSQSWDLEDLTDEWIRTIIYVIMSEEYNQALLDVMGTMTIFEFSKIVHIVNKNLVAVEKYKTFRASKIPTRHKL